MKTSVKIKQHDFTDCGAAFLASIAAHWQLHMPISRIRQFAGTDKKGTNILGLTEAAQKMGFNAVGVRGKTESLFKIPLPAIADLEPKDLNAEVCFDRKRNTYYYLSPFELQFSITVKAISNNDIVNLYGGCFFQKKYFTANIWQ